ncbi:membrane protein : Major facilitator superfamily MFS_1 OS=Chthoniobacter flavus Ellin428 GN=CfE428DRAFT_2805 PE=4 SV=1: MFS_1 [Gemmata massiliana]|uniref:Major facilitator superfamily (MFS) profile domain-containing protein n=1 Tax=Gemmata massiliana TaxID=1210884 RepID=A0A6P2D024_9BACT|nr:MFS transporter [Gemmata massiliana]VTR93715.1 membrane protein : Major facilitator superfamily MFS_1 OS=Chthoniobacter flavus Ellin428 GN=CfE428DRAFT_2805 PE=4 SV=1: MFS_1 [Gemmata massiliana]
MSTLPTAPITSPWRWWVCVLLMLATVINYMDRMALNQMAKEIKGAFALTNEQYGWLESVFSLAFAIGAIGTGFVVDRVSVRWVYPLMVVGWSVAGVLTGFATSFGVLLTCRFALGLFEAGNWPCGIRTTRAVLQPAERSFGNSLFQSGTALGAVITPLMVLALLRQAEVTGATDSWRLPFRVIGCLGLVWVALWFVTVPQWMLQPSDAVGAPAHQGATRFVDVFRDRRFWALVAMVMAVNFTWHGYRTWLPLYLQEQRGYSREAMSGFTTVYYLVADVGSWTVGLLTLVLCKRGLALHVSRLLAFAGCALLTICTVSVPFLPDGWALQTGLLAVAFGALGLFPTYFALTQELSSRHQGKVTGTLGACAHLSLFVVYPIEGWICDVTKSYEWVLGGVGVFPFLALVVTVALWPPRKEPPPPSVEAGT